jgi:hypothetical protein
LTRSQASFLARHEKQIQIIAGFLQSLKQAGELADDDGADRWLRLPQSIKAEA